MNLPATTSEHNPFATRHVRPGSLPYHFPPGLNATVVVERLATAGWQGQIVGPHGSGKSTLLATLLPALESAGRRPRLITLHDGERRLPERLDSKISLDKPVVIVVDGYEQLGLWHRWRLVRWCRRREWGLLVTTHRSVGLPTVFETSTTVELAREVIDRLAPGQALIDQAELAARFQARQGNLRELLFDCYDLYRRRSSGEPDAASSSNRRVSA
jgi:hypothetical protein